MMDMSMTKRQLAQAALKIEALQKGFADQAELRAKHEAGFTETIAQLQAQLAAVTDECAQLNNVLRQAGWGQGEIDSAAYTFDKLVQANREHVAERDRLRKALSCAEQWFPSPDDTSATRAAINSMRNTARYALHGGKGGGG